MKYYTVGITLNYDDIIISHHLFTSKKEELLTYLRNVYRYFDYAWNFEKTVDNFFQGISVEQSAFQEYRDGYGGDIEEWKEFKEEHENNCLEECWIWSQPFDKIIHNSIMETE